MNSFSKRDTTDRVEQRRGSGNEKEIEICIKFIASRR